MARRVTLAEVAKQAGYSVSTVSLVLNNREGTRIAERTAQKIRETAAQMGYSADPRARSLRLGKSEAIGFVSDEVTITRYASAMVTGAVERAQEADRVVLVSECGGREGGRDRAVEALLERRIDGLVVGLMRSRLIDLPRGVREVPSVVVNGAAPGLVSVLPDEFLAGQVATQFLLERGHRRIALVGRHPSQQDPRWSLTLSRRFAGIDSAMAAAGVQFEAEYEVKSWEPQDGFDAAMHILADHDVTAILCGNDRLAFGVYRAAAELGMNIPEDLSVMSFDDEQLATYMSPGLTTMRLPYEEMGCLGAQVVLAGGDSVTSGGFVDRAGLAGAVRWADSRFGGGVGAIGGGGAGAVAGLVGEILVEMPLITRESVRNLA